MSFYVESEGQRILFSGDILFVGDVGRPDLRDMHADPLAMASALYDTLHNVLYRLPEDTVVYPAHGAGSLCGRKLGSAPSTTIGAEKVTNWANTFQTRAEFVEAMVSNLPDRPLFFYHCPFVNLQGARPLAEVPQPQFALDEPGDYLSRYGEAVILDTRTAEEYGTEHLAGSLNIGLDRPLFSTWVGFFVRPETPIVLVVDRPEDAEQAWLELARIGYENVVGYLMVEVDLWMAAGLEVQETPQINVCCLEAWQREGRHLLDVRTPGEWNEGHIDGAYWIPLPSLPERLREVPAGPVAVICGTGYRSSLATSLLERGGRANAVNVRGGWSAWSNRQCAEPDAQELVCRQVIGKAPLAA
jgi:rhodanese-related sulfurtransferase